MSQVFLARTPAVLDMILTSTFTMVLVPISAEKKLYNFGIIAISGIDQQLGGKIGKAKIKAAFSSKRRALWMPNDGD
jgi:hypothetical protein